MKQTINWYHWISAMFKEFLKETSNKSYAQIVDIYECKKTGFTKAIIKLSDRHTIEKNISDIILDNMLIESLDKQTVRTLTYMATVERLKPDYSIIVQKMTGEVDEYLLEIKSKKEKKILQKSPSELCKDKTLIAKFTPVEANRIGYLAGIRDTVKEYKLRKLK